MDCLDDRAVFLHPRQQREYLFVEIRLQCAGRHHAPANRDALIQQFPHAARVVAVQMRQHEQIHRQMLRTQV